MGDPQGGLEAAVAKLKEAYGKSKMFVTGSLKDYEACVYSRSPRLEEIWNGLALWCNMSQVNPRAYVEWCFHREYPAYPMPSRFNTNFRKNEYISSGKPDITHQRTRMKYELMIKRLNKIQSDQDLVEHLLDPLNTFDPVFIYTIARNMERQDELPEDILVRARHQVFCQPVYAEKFQDILPKELLPPWT